MARKEIAQRQSESLLDNPELIAKLQAMDHAGRRELAKKYGVKFAEDAPIDKAAARQSAAELLLKLSEAESKWAKSQQNPNKYGLLKTYLTFMGTMSGIEERGATSITGKKVTGDYALAQSRMTQLEELEAQRNTKIPAASRADLITAASAWADDDLGVFSEKFHSEVVLGPQEQQAERLSFLAQKMGTSTDAVLAAAEQAGMSGQGVAGTEREIGLEGLSEEAQNILDRETGLLNDVNALMGKVGASGGGLGSRGRAWSDSVTKGFATIMESGDPAQIAELFGLGAGGVPANATHGEIFKIATDIVDFTDEGFQHVLATTHKRDLLYGNSEASRQFREVAERRGYGDLDPEDQYSYLAREYDAEVGKSGIGSDLNFAYNVLRGGQTASLGDKIKAASIIALRPGQYAELRRQREGGSEAEAHENAARVVEQQAAGESPVEAAEEESKRGEGEPVADENRLAAMRTETAGRLAGGEPEEAAEPPAGAGPSRAVRESLQRSVDAHGNAVPIPGIEGGMIIPGGGGQVHVPGPDGELIPYTAPAAAEELAAEEEPVEGPVATLPEGAVNKATEGWADYHLYKDGTIRFIHPETGEIATVTETSDPESYSAIKQKAFGEAPVGEEPLSGPEEEPLYGPEEAPGPGDLDVDFAGLGEAPEEVPAVAEAPAAPTVYDRAFAIYEARQRGEVPSEESESSMARRFGVYGGHASQRPGQLTEGAEATSGTITSSDRGWAQPGNVGYVPSEGEKELLKIEQLAGHMEKGTPSFLGFGGKTGIDVRGEALKQYGTSGPPAGSYQTLEEALADPDVGKPAPAAAAAPAPAPAPAAEPAELGETVLEEEPYEPQESLYTKEERYPTSDQPPTGPEPEVVAGTDPTVDPSAPTQADPLDPRLLAEENVDRLSRQSGTAFDVDEGFEPPVVRGESPKLDFDFGTDTTEDMLKREDPPADLSAERGVSEEEALAMNEPPLGTSPVSSYEPPSVEDQDRHSGQDFALQKIDEETQHAGQDRRLQEIDEETRRATDVTAEDLGEGAEGQRKLEERERLLAEDEKARQEALRASAPKPPGAVPGSSPLEDQYPTSPQEEDQYPTSQTGSEFARGMEGYMAEPPPLKPPPEMTASESQVTGIPTATKAASPPNLSMAQGATGEATSKRAKHNEALMKTLSKQLAARNQQPTP